jgi:hypothetical protein
MPCLPPKETGIIAFRTPIDLGAPQTKIAPRNKMAAGVNRRPFNEFWRERLRQFQSSPRFCWQDAGAREPIDYRLWMKKAWSAGWGLGSILPISAEAKKETASAMSRMPMIVEPLPLRCSGQGWRLFMSPPGEAAQFV